MIPDHAAGPDIAIRPITPADDGAVAAVIRTVMDEFDCTGAGFAIHDPEVDAMHAAYAAPGCRFFVITAGGRVAGCGGYGPLAGAEAGVCELRKMYFLPGLRGRGLGERFLRLLLDAMREDEYRRCYLETTSWMTAAQRLYERLGFAAVADAMGATGHHGCDRFYIRDL